MKTISFTSRSSLRHTGRRQGGVALLEAMIASVLLAVGLLGAIGMQARAYATLSDAGMRAEATMASEKLLATMTLDQANLAAYAYGGSGPGSAQIAPWVAQTRAVIPNASLTVTVVPATATRAQVDINIGWQRKQNGQANVHAITSYIASAK